MKFDLSHILKEFSPGSEIICLDHGNIEFYKNKVEYVTFNAEVSEVDVTNKLDFLCVYFRFRYNGKFVIESGKQKYVWLSCNSLRENRVKSGM